jgi:hypothetical protein
MMRSDHHVPSGGPHVERESLASSRAPVPGLQALVDDVLRTAVAAARDGSLRGTLVADSDPMSELCAAARANDVRAETLLLAIKDRWRRLPESHGPGRLDAEVTLAAVITRCIREYYAPRRA